MKKTFASFVLLFLLAGCTNSSVVNEETEVFRIGAIGPLTGEAASYGEALRKVVEMETERINEVGGVNGKSLEILWEDGKCNPSDAALAGQKLINIDKVNTIITFCSGETLGVAPISEKNKVIVISSFASSPEVTNAGDFVFRTDPNGEKQSEISAEYSNIHFPRIAILHEQADYSVTVVGAFEKYYTGEIVMKESFLLTESDYKTRLTKLKNEDIDGIFLLTQFPNKFDILLKQMEELQWEVPILTNEIATGNSEIVQNHKEFLTDKLIASDFVVPENEQFTTFVQEYKERYEDDPQYLAYAATTVDMMRVLGKVLNEVSDTSDTEAIRDALYATKDFESMFGKLSFDAKGDVDINYTLFSFNGEDFVPLSIDE